MFGWAIATGKKIISLILAFFIIYSFGANYFSKEILDLIFLSFLIGMVLPDIDLITNFLKKFIHSLAIFLFLIGAIVVIFYPASITLANNLCVAVAQPIDPSLKIYCNIIFLSILLIFFYVIARLIVGFFPSENFMHNYLALVFFSIGGYVFLIFLVENEIAVLLSVVFFIAYFIHLAIDSSYHYHKN
ncbi:MAG: hypothetical protein QXV64_01720 [Candidatus Anstonellaceae archaeon]